ncbi:MAG: hypothetical protein H6664_12780 [Ardenticatenaceae bacterium]|nr:hypothetical protein [Ardenticatenaceae bacterium]MCB9005243.1 hypothetical protein [Ardenticatenaceae bacterium]
MIQLRLLCSRWGWGLLLLLTAVTACTQPQPSPSTPIVSPTMEVSMVTAVPTSAQTAASASPSPASLNHTATATLTPTTLATLAAYPPPTGEGSEAYFPIVSFAEASPTPTATATATAVPTPTPSPTPTPIPIVDFPAVRAQLQVNGQELAYVKIGFHTAVGGNGAGLDEWMRQLDAAGVPFFLKSVGNAQPLYFAQELMKQSGVPHTLVYRRSGNEYDVPLYDLPADEAARIHWQRHIEVWPPELDPSLVWIETTNEIDKTRSEWMAQFALTTAQLALADGYKYAAFSWASGEPEPTDWQTPAMLQFLRLAAQYPDRIAISLHEYSYLTDDIGHEYPHKIGRFQELFRICDQYGIPRPTVLITEWGWTYENVPSPEAALRDIAWAAHMYAQFPQVKGAAIWYLGGGFANIANQAQRLIYPVMVYALTNYFAIPTAQPPINPEQFRP